jgi:hypothetical protein
MDGMSRFIVGHAGGDHPRLGNAHRCMIAARDVDSTDSFNFAGWSHRLEFFALQSASPGTTRFIIGEAGGGDPAVNAHRCMIEAHDADSSTSFNHSGWRHKLEFFAWAEPHPGTIPFFVGEAGGGAADNKEIGPHRIMINTDENDSRSRGWTHRLTFYAFPSRDIDDSGYKEGFREGGRMIAKLFMASGPDALHDVLTELREGPPAQDGLLDRRMLVDVCRHIKENNPEAWTSDVAKAFGEMLKAIPADDDSTEGKEA